MRRGYYELKWHSVVEEPEPQGERDFPSDANREQEQEPYGKSDFDCVY